MTCRTATDQRKSELARIHIAKQQLALDEETYRAMLWTVARVHSSADLDHAGRQAVLAHLRGRGFRQRGRRGHPGRPHNINTADRGPLLQKIEAYLAESGRPWAYADGMARRICKRDRVALCDASQLRKLVAALEYDARRHRRAAD